MSRLLLPVLGISTDRAMLGLVSVAASVRRLACRLGYSGVRMETSWLVSRSSNSITGHAAGHRSISRMPVGATSPINSSSTLSDSLYLKLFHYLAQSLPLVLVELIVESVPVHSRNASTAAAGLTNIRLRMRYDRWHRGDYDPAGGGLPTSLCEPGGGGIWRVRI